MIRESGFRYGDVSGAFSLPKFSWSVDQLRGSHFRAALSRREDHLP
jgi:hypothetical protein